MSTPFQDVRSLVDLGQVFVFSVSFSPSQKPRRTGAPKAPPTAHNGTWKRAGWAAKHLFAGRRRGGRSSSGTGVLSPLRQAVIFVSLPRPRDLTLRLAAPDAGTAAIVTRTRRPLRGALESTGALYE